MSKPKPKLYIVHGWTYTTDYWQPLLTELKQRGIIPILLNVPGLTKPSEHVWKMEDYVAWLEEQIEGEDLVYLLGHSNGGRIALNFAAQHSHRLKQLILIGSAGVYHDELLLKLKRNVLGTAAKAGKKIVPSQTARKLFYRAIGVRDYYEAPPNMRQTMQHMLESDKWLEPGKIKVETTLIWGDQDPATPLADGQHLHKLIEGSSLKIIKGAGHAPYHTHTAAVADIIEQTIKAD